MDTSSQFLDTQIGESFYFIQLLRLYKIPTTTPSFELVQEVYVVIRNSSIHVISGLLTKVSMGIITGTVQHTIKMCYDRQ